MQDIPGLNIFLTIETTEKGDVGGNGEENSEDEPWMAIRSPGHDEVIRVVEDAMAENRGPARVVVENLGESRDGGLGDVL